MPIEVGAPPKVKGLRRRYDDFFETLIAANGDWASLPLIEVGGAANKNKQSALFVGGHVRGYKIQTTVQGDRIYARIVGAKAVDVSERTT